MEQLAGATGSIYLGPAIVVPDEDSMLLKNSAVILHVLKF